MLWWWGCCVDVMVVGLLCLCVFQSCSDGTAKLWSTKDWECLKVMTASSVSSSLLCLFLSIVPFVSFPVSFCIPSRSEFNICLSVSLLLLLSLPPCLSVSIAAAAAAVAAVDIHNGSSPECLWFESPFNSCGTGEADASPPWWRAGSRGRHDNG